MKKYYLVLFLFIFSRLAFAQESITVQANTVIKDVSHHPVGINVDYLMDDDTYLQPETSTTSALQEMGVKFLRFPGGEKSDNYIWGQYPYTSANPTLALSGACHWPNEDPRFVLDDHKNLKPTTLDFDEFMVMVKETGTEPLIVVNGDGFHNNGGTCGGVPSRDSLLMAARQWVKYANVVKKYNIKYWMIGNESYHSAAYDGAVSANDYLNDLIDFAQAMKAEDPSIKIVVNGLSDSWWETILSNSTAAGLIDYLGVSVYPIYNWSTGYDHYRTTSPNFTSSINVASNAITKYVTNTTDRQRIKVIATEYNTIDWAEGGWLNRNDVGHALVAFDMLGKLLQVPKLDLAFFWNTRYVDNREIPFNVFDALSSTGKMQANGLALSVWGKYLLNDLVTVNSTASIVSYASKSATGLNVFLLNKDTQAHTVDLNINDFVTSGTAERFTYQGTSTSDTAPVFAPSDPVASLSSGTSQYSLQVEPASITVLRFTKAIEVSQQVSSLTLVNADNEADLQALVNGSTLNLATLPTRSFNIRANTNPATVGSVKFTLSGTQSKTATESGKPYALFGDDVHGDYYAWTPAVGSYTLTATPYTAAKGAGTAGTTLTVSFTVVDQAPEENQPLISNVSATTGNAYTVTDVAAGKLMYTDRTYKITSVPASLAGASLIQTANNDKWNTSTSLLSFRLAQKATVYIAYDPRGTTLPAWLSGWQKLSDRLGVDDSKISSMDLYSKSFEAGEVTLGGNKASPAAGAENNYLVLALAAVTPATSSALVSNVAAASGRSYSLAEAQAGELMYTDRTYQITSVPSFLQNAALIQPANDDKKSTSTSLLSFELSEQAVVYVAYDPRGTTLPGWLSGWQKLSDRLGVDDSQISSMDLYSKSFEAGEVTLGGNLASPARGAQTNYLVIAVPANQTLTATQITAAVATEKSSQNPSLRVFPNPNTGNQIWVELGNLTKEEQVAITLFEPVTGRKLFRYSFRADSSGGTSFQLPLKQALKPGLYLINVVTKSGKEYAKLLVTQ
ncbi:hypothetical protein I2I11_10320 [Pontibacter sp. 172403-2]|uniref:hypothetical protein n=1 Tax=Pontibacter rufus TaxID=2791028 RepID=UPI0018AF977B|nr:hypothetical protein [Pontibacter sp. 172403-2]MBF9253687.1 hypothetical protein [Pontibacter sp. 172403-2]